MDLFFPVSLWPAGSDDQADVINIAHPDLESASSHSAPSDVPVDEERDLSLVQGFCVIA